MADTAGALGWLEKLRVRFRMTDYVDNGWPTTDPKDHAVSELASDRTGALSPFGDVEFPVPTTDLPYVHPVTAVNR